MIAVASIALAVWLYLLLARGAFWRCSERDDWAAAQLPAWPRVAAVVPARNEADCVGDSIGSLLAQDYRGGWTVILVDDDSNDGTAEIARRAANADARLRVVTSRGLPAGWTGKLWAAKQAIDAGNAYQAMEQVSSAATAFTDDAVEGFASFSEKREPRYSGT